MGALHYVDLAAASWLAWEDSCATLDAPQLAVVRRLIPPARPPAPAPAPRGPRACADAGSRPPLQADRTDIPPGAPARWLRPPPQEGREEREASSAVDPGDWYDSSPRSRAVERRQWLDALRQRVAARRALAGPPAQPLPQQPRSAAPAAAGIASAAARFNAQMQRYLEYRRLMATMGQPVRSGKSRAAAPGLAAKCRAAAPGPAAKPKAAAPGLAAKPAAGKPTRSAAFLR
eukprot:SM000075S21979  [mRNA]  locus=s75:431767:432462:+ [translate_table: standard]